MESAAVLTSSSLSRKKPRLSAISLAPESLTCNGFSGNWMGPAQTTGPIIRDSGEEDEADSRYRTDHLNRQKRSFTPIRNLHPFPISPQNRLKMNGRRKLNSKIS